MKKFYDAMKNFIDDEKFYAIIKKSHRIENFIINIKIMKNHKNHKNHKKS